MEKLIEGIFVDTREFVVRDRFPSAVIITIGRDL